MKDSAQVTEYQSDPPARGTLVPKAVLLLMVRELGETAVNTMLKTVPVQPKLSSNLLQNTAK